MKRTVIQKHSSSIVRNLIETADVLSGLQHKLTKGELKELFVSNVLNAFLTSQFSIGSGVIINQKGQESAQTDIIIYDNRILPPFIREQNIGVYPAEGVIATIEIKSILNKRDLLSAEKSAEKLHRVIYHPESTIYPDDTKYKPLCGVIGFSGGIKGLSEQDSGKKLLAEKINRLFGICLIQKYCWMNVGQWGWKIRNFDSSTYEEVKRFIAVFLDNIRTRSEQKMKVMMQEKHKDWLTKYIRN